MSLILVTHDTDEPALYGGLAAAAATRLDADLAHLPARFDTARFADAAQHVTVDGALVGSGLLWRERFAGTPAPRETTIEAVLAASRQGDVVLPLHPAFTGSAGAELVARAEVAGIAVRRYDVVPEGRSLRFVGATHRDVESALGLWSRDAFGRLGDGQGSRSPITHGRRLRIGLVGTALDHGSAYPAALAALGDAADAAGCEVDVLFIDPPSLRAEDIPGIIAEVDGVLLPGGADMINVPGQILMARGALDTRTPAVGLCLGMQTMTTAAIQKVLGAAEVNLAEADPAARIKSFTAIAAIPGLSEHRLGERMMQIESGSRLAAILGASSYLRYNHRFHVNHVLLPDARAAGLRVSAWDETGRIVDAIEADDHPFYIGLQGHPELLSKPGRPHPIFSDFLRSVQRL